MTTTDATKGNPAQPVSETAPSAMLALSVEEAIAHFGITPQAVRKRIKAGHLAAERDGRVWRVCVDAQPDEVSETATGRKFREPPQPNHAKPVAQSARDQFALMVEPIVTPRVAKVEELSREAERNLQRAVAAETERDELRRQVEELRAESAQKSTGGTSKTLDAGHAPASEESSQNAPRAADWSRGAAYAEGLSPETFAAPFVAEATRRASWWKRLIWGE